MSISKHCAILAGDIGGTNTRLAVHTLKSGAKEPMANATFASASYATLESLVAEFLETLDIDVVMACFGVAGPVRHGRARVTNLPWRLDEDALAAAIGVKRVVLLNDLVSTAYGTLSLSDDDVHVVNKGLDAKGDARAVLAPGTGLGVAYMVPSSTGYRVYPSEGGHADFAPADERQRKLLGFLQQRFSGHVSYERVCSGIGIPNIARFLSAEYPSVIDPVIGKIDTYDDPTPVILEAGLSSRTDAPLCAQSVDLFIEILGAAAGNTALHYLATGGLYLGGGLPPRLIDRIDDGVFMSAFTAKGRMSDLLFDTPVYVVKDTRTSLSGVAWYALDCISSM